MKNNKEKVIDMLKTNHLTVNYSNITSENLCAIAFLSTKSLRDGGQPEHRIHRE